ncbi:MAG TPA: DinB family protein [Vicinamibacterales bacterium]|nr:DinB family protein [Vicinamibacterales bacterium]
MSIDAGFVDRFDRVVADAYGRMLAMDDAETAARPAPGKWSPKEIVGHLIDSAVNNQARFVRAQAQDDLVFAGYDQDAWVRAQRYNDRSWRDLVETWRALNGHVAAVMRVTPSDVADRPRARHNLAEIGFQQPPPVATLAFLMRDYVVHLQHHLRQIFR